MKNKFLLLSAAILFAFTPMLAGTSVSNAKEKVATSLLNGKTVSLDEVQAYMAQFQIIIVGITTITGSENVYARDDHGQNYVVYIQAGYIVTWDNADL